MSIRPLPNSDQVFELYFAPWYDQGHLESRRWEATRPDVEEWSEPNTPAAVASRLTEESQAEVIGPHRGDGAGRSDADDFSNDLFVTVCEFGAVIGDVMRRAEAQLVWLADWPYWESGLLDVPSGYRINVFHWAIKRFSEYGIDDGYARKVTTCLEHLRNGWKRTS